MANSWRLRGCRSSSAPAGKPFLHWTECALRSLRQRLVLANCWRRWPKVHLSRVGIRVFNAAHPFPSHLPQAIGLLLINALGIFAIVAPLVWLFVAWRKTWQASEGISLAAVAILLLMTFGMGRNGTSDNAHEFIHHPFVWAYWLVGSLTAGRLVFNAGSTSSATMDPGS